MLLLYSHLLRLSINRLCCHILVIKTGVLDLQQINPFFVVFSQQYNLPAIRELKNLNLSVQFTFLLNSENTTPL